jgi:hypothetical protein
MATISPSWTENVSVRASANLGAGASDTNSIDLANLGADLSVVQVDIDIGSSSGVTVEFFSDSNSGSKADTTPILSYTVDSDDIRSIPIYGHPYIDVKVTNDDGSNAVTDITIVHSWRQWTSS